MANQTINILAVLACALFSVALSAETTCQTHQKNTRGGLMQWDIKCDTQGRYSPPLQCTVQTPKWCACYNSEEAITSPSRNVKICNCPMALNEEMKKANCRVSDNTCRDRVTLKALKCSQDGKFEKRQCSGVQCRCVDSMTGQQTVAPSNNANLQCP